MDAQLARLEAVATRLENAARRIGGGGGGDGGDEKEASPQVQDYDAFFASAVKPFVETCAKLDETKAIGQDTDAAFSHLRSVIEATSACKKPSQQELMKFIDPIVQVVSKAQNVDNKAANFAHAKAFSEFIQCMNWLLMPGPAAVVEATLDQADFYLIKVLTSAKSLDDPAKQTHRDYVNQMKTVVKELSAFVKSNFKMGLSWNPQGKPLSEYSSGGGAPAAPPTGGAPPPPPPVNAVAVAAAQAARQESKAAPTGGGAAGGLGAVFAEINKKKDNAAAGLRKVTKDMKTKNRADRSGAVPAGPAKKAPAKKWGAGSAAPAVKKPPKMELRQGTHWVENYENEQLELKDVQMKQAVFIYNCSNTVIQIPSKCKTVQVDKCTKCRIFFQNVVSTFEVVNSKRLQITVLDSCPSLAVDKSDGVQIHFTTESIKHPPLIVTSNVSELNLSVPGKTENDDPVEVAVPEQFQTTLSADGTIETVPVQHGD